VRREKGEVDGILWAEEGKARKPNRRLGYSRLEERGNRTFGESEGQKEVGTSEKSH